MRYMSMENHGGIVLTWELKIRSPELCGYPSNRPEGTGDGNDEVGRNEVSLSYFVSFSNKP
jgi:hypothetical protein